MIAIVVLSGVLCLLAINATSAFANRTYDSRISGEFIPGEGFNQPENLAFDANDNVWIADQGHHLPNDSEDRHGIYEYNAYPSQTLLEAPDTNAAWGSNSQELTVAVDQSSGEVFASQSNGRTINIFENGHLTQQWKSINGAQCCTGDTHIAIDNSTTPSRGRVYLSLASPEDDIEALDDEQRPVQFPAAASYIDKNKLTGTPSGAFGKVENITVDNNGNIYVTDGEKGVVDEFESTGLFLRTFPDPSALSDAERSFPGSGGVGVDPTNGNVLITGNFTKPLEEYDSAGNFLETLKEDASGHMQTEGSPGVNSEGYLYLPTNSGIDIFSPNGVVPEVTYQPVSHPTTTSGTLNATVDPNGGGPITQCQFEYGAGTSYSGGTIPCTPDPNAASPGSNFTEPTDVSAEISGLATESEYHYRVVVKCANGTKYGADQIYTPDQVLGLSTDASTALSESGATLNASFLGNGEDTHYYFEWGPTTAYGHTSAASPGEDAGTPSGPNRTSLSFELNGLDSYATYHYRIVATNAGGTSDGADKTFTTLPGVPSGRNLLTTAVHSDRAVLHGEINPNGAATSARFEYVDDSSFQQSGWANAASAPAPEVAVGMGKEYQSVTTLVNGLQPGTLYHFRAVGANEAGSGSTGATFKTFPFIPSFNDPCPNAHVRQQTGAALLLDCRAYELVSAANAGGYDVESNLVEGQTPFADYPEARSSSGEPQVLYGVHDGGIPGTGDPTNHGVDPYVATRVRNRLEHEIRRHPRQRPLRQWPLRLDPAGSRRKP